MNRLENLIPLVKPFYSAEDPAHDWPHIGRVIATCRKLASNEAVDLPCLLAAAYCHDIVNLPKNHPDRSRASELAAEKAAPLLEQSGFSSEEIKKIHPNPHGLLQQSNKYSLGNHTYLWPPLLPTFPIGWIRTRQSIIGQDHRIGSSFLDQGP